MLSHDEVKNISFRRATFGGYKPEDVDNFVDNIQISYEELLRERENLTKTVQKLENTLKKFYDEENSIRKVLLELKTVTEKSVNDAQIKASEIVSEANQTSEKIIKEAEQKVLIQKEISDSLKKESKRLKKCLEDLYLEHMEIVKKIPDVDFENIKIPSNNSPETHIDLNTDKKNIKTNNTEPVFAGKPIVTSSNANINTTNVNKLPENLQFGANYSLNKSSFIDSAGIYKGTFRKE